MRSTASAENWPAVVVRPSPALAIKRSIGPSSPAKRATADRVAAGSVASAGATAAVPPRARISPARASSARAALGPGGAWPAGDRVRAGSDPPALVRAGRPGGRRVPPGRAVRHAVGRFLVLPPAGLRPDLAAWSTSLDPGVGPGRFAGPV